MPDLELQTFKIQITMKKEQNLQEPQKQALNILVVIGRFLQLFNKKCPYCGCKNTEKQGWVLKPDKTIDYVHRYCRDCNDTFH